MGLIGTNGAGKTSFMNGVGGLVPADGRVEIYGTDVSRLAAHRRHRHHLGRAFQAATLFGDLTVRDNPLVVASYLGTDTRAIARSDAGAEQ